MTDLYVQCLAAPDGQIDGRVWNAGYENHTVMQLAETVKDVVGGPIALEVVPTDDNPLYHVSSERIRREFGFIPRHSIGVTSVADLNQAFKDGPSGNSDDEQPILQHKGHAGSAPEVDHWQIPEGNESSPQYTSWAKCESVRARVCHCERDRRQGLCLRGRTRRL